MTNTPDLKGSSFTLSVLHLTDNNIENALQFLQEKVAQAPAFFASAPVVINVEKVEADIDFIALKQAVITAGFVPVGISGCTSNESKSSATEAGFALMTASKTSAKPTEKPQPKKVEEPTPEEKVEVTATSIPTKIVRTPIRSGQQVYAKDCDLVILNHVSAGAEVIADGSIHIHGTLRGRAIAGASGQHQAHIICEDLQAELISIAGNYWLSDQISSEYWQKKVMVSQIDESLTLETLTK